MNRQPHITHIPTTAWTVQPLRPKIILHFSVKQINCHSYKLLFVASSSAKWDFTQLQLYISLLYKLIYSNIYLENRKISNISLNVKQIYGSSTNSDQSLNLKHSLSVCKIPSHWKLLRTCLRRPLTALLSELFPLFLFLISFAKWPKRRANT